MAVGSIDEVARWKATVFWLSSLGALLSSALLIATVFGTQQKPQTIRFDLPPAGVGPGFSLFDEPATTPGR